MRVIIDRQMGRSAKFSGDNGEDDVVLSRRCTGTTFEDLSGIFTEQNNVAFWVSDLKREFTFPEVFSLVYTPLKDIARIVQQRAEIVQEWVQSIPVYEKFMFKLPDPEPRGGK